MTMLFNFGVCGVDDGTILQYTNVATQEFVSHETPSHEYKTLWEEPHFNMDEHGFFMQL